MASATILLVSVSVDLTDQVRTITDSLPGLDLTTSPGIEAAYERDDWSEIKLVLIHQSHHCPAAQVMRLLRMIAAARRPVATVVLGEPGDDEQALALLRLGVAEYLGLPLDGKILAHLCDILTIRHRRGAMAPTEAAAAGGPLAAPACTEGPASAAPTGLSAGSAILDGSTPQVATLVEQVRQVAPQSATVLLGGETGTGKSHVARQIHELSDRRDEPFLRVDCETLAGPTIEEELFGRVGGPSDDPGGARTGRFAQAGRGTLFLDGVDALPLPVQAKVLRVLEDRAFEPVGGDRPVPLMARLIAASNRPLVEQVAERRFRSDLFYRLNVVGLQLPPLRERRDAIAPLAQRFLSEFAAAHGREFDPIDEETLQALREHDWPGNIRELRTVLDRCLATCASRTVRRENLPSFLPDAATRFAGDLAAGPIPAGGHLAVSSLARTTGQAEYARITEALRHHGNNRLRAAGELGISRMTLYKKLYKYGLMKRGGRNDLVIKATPKPVS